VGARQVSGFARARRYLCAIFVTVGVPLAAMIFKTPEECHITSVIKATIADEELLEITEEQLEFCKKHFKLASIAAVFAVVLGPIYNFVLSSLLAVSLCCTAKLYKLYVGSFLALFDLIEPYVVPVLFASSSKPANHNIHTLSAVWARLAYLPYTIVLWFVGVIVVISAWCGDHISFSVVLALFLWQTYFPLLVAIFKGDSILQEVTTQELQRRALQIRPVAKEPHQERGDLSDVWWRLFQNYDLVFTCSSAELDLLVRYFEESQRGVEDENWPIWWHDDLCLSENNQMQAVYLDDLNFLITRESYMPKGNNSSDNGTEQLMDKLDNEVLAERFIHDTLARLEKLQAENPVRKSQHGS